LEGRKNWSPDGDDEENFKSVATEIVSMQIYKDNPLN
jgi:hypothetical protein